MADEATATPVREAATVLLVRDRPAFQVLMVKRHHAIDFASGALVFPGGKTEAGDHGPGWRSLCIGWDGVAEVERPLRIAAIREAFEEAGVLLAQDDAGAAYPGGDACEAARATLAQDATAFPGLVRELGVRLDLAALAPFARWITPAMMPKRFDTWFYIAHAHDALVASCDGRETVDAEWIAPAEALRLAAAGEREVIFPTRMNLQMLAEAQDAADAVARARVRPVVVVEPRVTRREDGARVLTIPSDAGYGAVTEPLERIAGVARP